MFARLGADAFVGSDHEKHSIDPAYAGKHIADEVAVSRHIDNPDGFTSRQSHGRETKVNGHLAGNFFLQAVRVGACQGSNQR